MKYDWTNNADKDIQAASDQILQSQSKDSRHKNSLKSNKIPLRDEFQSKLGLWLKRHAPFHLSVIITVQRRFLLVNVYSGRISFRGT